MSLSADSFYFAIGIMTVKTSHYTYNDFNYGLFDPIIALTSCGEINVK